MVAISASHRRAADPTSVSSTACRSKVERLMALSTSGVAVCCAIQPFSAYAVFIHKEAGDVATGPRQALDKSPADRIDDRPEYDRHFGTRSLDCHHGRAATHHHDVRGERD